MAPPGTHGRCPCREIAQASKLLLWGCSATLRRHDGLGLDTVFEQISFHRGLLDIMRDGWLATAANARGRHSMRGALIARCWRAMWCRLSPMRVFSVSTRLDLSQLEVSSRGGGERDFVLAQLARIINTPARNDLVVDSWMRLAAGRTWQHLETFSTIGTGRLLDKT